MTRTGTRRQSFRTEGRLGIARRRIVQAVSLVALNSSVAFDLKWICMPVLNCHGCALAWFACPIGVFVHYAGYRLFPLMAIGSILLVGAFVGRFLCGWVCPFGFLQDLLYKIPSRKIELPDWTRAVKYPVFAVTVVILPFFLGESTLLSFCRFCPASALQVTIPGFFTDGVAGIGIGTAAKLGILLAVLLVSIMHSRFFCRVLCPIAVVLAPFNYFSLVRVKKPQKCTSCTLCDAVCPMQVRPLGRAARGIPTNRHHDCVECRDCSAVCHDEARRKPHAAAGVVPAVVETAAPPA
jgi:ferredoxin-type protein NapH